MAKIYKNRVARTGYERKITRVVGGSNEFTCIRKKIETRSLAYSLTNSRYMFFVSKLIKQLGHEC